MTKESAEAAGLRVRSTAARLAELRTRLDRLQRGDPTTLTDVQRARLQAEAQAEAVTVARERLLLMHRSAAAHHEAQAQWLTSAGRPQQADRERDAARRAHAAARRHLQPLAVPTVTLAGPDADEMERLRAGVAALLSWAGVGDLDRVEQRRAWCRAVVEECATAEWRGWAHAVCVVGASMLPGVRGVAVTVITRPGSAEFVAASDRWTARVQELELIVGEGPGTSAHAGDGVVHAHDLAVEDGRWPAYATVACDLQVRGVSAVPLRVQDRCVGSLTLYYRTAADETPLDLGDAAAFADIAAAALVADVEQVRFGRPGGESSFTMHVATGAMSARLGVPTAEAEARLRAYAFSAGLTLLEVAEQALSGTLDLR